MAIATVECPSPFDHRGPWTWDDLVDLPDGHRYEIVDGALLMAPAPELAHNRAAYNLCRILDDACPPGLIAVPFAGVAYATTAREPDVLVTRRPPPRHRGPLDPRLVCLTAEVQSPGSITTDRVTKFHEYASVGIAHYWRVELEPETLLVAYVLRDGAYVEVATVRGDEPFVTTEPFPLTVAPSALVL